MTVIAYDGRYVAADKQGTAGPKLYTVNKLFVIGRRVVSFDGGWGHGLALVQWFREGADPARYPAPPEDNAYLHVFEHGKPVVTYESAYAGATVDAFSAWGTGGGCAFGAMAMGANAMQAVEIACRFADGCGKGVDYFDLEEVARDHDRAHRPAAPAEVGGAVSSQPG